MPDIPERCRVAIVGGGAAGLMAAIAAAGIWAERHNQSPAEDPQILILEKMDRVGRKLLATGNGRCNISNQNLSIVNYHGRHPEFAETALKKLSVSATLDLFQGLGLRCRTESEGKIYPYSLQAASVLDILRHSAARMNVRTEPSFSVAELQPDKSTGRFSLTAADGRKIFAERVIIATGGLAAPAMGCDGSGYKLLTRFGHCLTTTFPALVQVKTELDLVKGLAGLKFDGTVRVMAGRQCLQTAAGEILFTDYGLSGPPILEIARVINQRLRKNPADNIQIFLDLLPEMGMDELVQWLTFRRQLDLKLELSEYLTGLVSKKIGQAVLKRCLDRTATLAAAVEILDSSMIMKLAAMLKALSIRAVGTQDWRQAQVTAGGLDTDDFDPVTMESRLQPGVYAAGEILDIDGDCGGYNLQWAWSSGYTAGSSAMLACLSES